MKHSILLLFLFPSLGFAGAPKFDTILYGVSYYHEYMPYDRLEKDVELMEKAGITVVRLGESTWSSWEPRDGEFEFAWMERILDRLHKAGIKVIIGTPTYSIPPWLYQSIRKLPCRSWAHASRFRPTATRTPTSGSPWGAYGLRQNVDITHSTYRWYAERVIRQEISHFAKHPAVIGYQIDNETRPNSSNSRSMHADFLDHLKKKFGSVEKLNRLWGFVYWGQLVSDGTISRCAKASSIQGTSLSGNAISARPSPISWGGRRRSSANTHVPDNLLPTTGRAASTRTPTSTRWHEYPRHRRR